MSQIDPLPDQSATHSWRAVPTVWIDAEKIEEHVHLKIHTGKQYGQEDMPTYERRNNHRNDAGLAGTLILRADQWPSFIKALAVGGHETGLRVCWSEHNEDRRNLWNGAPDQPCVIGTVEPVEWDRADSRTLDEQSANTEGS